MANPSGTNQFGGFSDEQAYGAIKRQSTLTREAPMSGAPVATHATETPRRAKRQGASTAGHPAEAGAPAPPLEPRPEMTLRTIFQAWANEPDASDLVRTYATMV